jgi:hypothetical protein
MAEGRGKVGKYGYEDELDSSPMAPLPEIRSEVFGTPGRRVPGVSVLTPAKGRLGGRAGSGLGGGKGFGEGGGGGKGYGGGGWESDEDDDDSGVLEGMSPPKTMSFYIPQSQLLKTPGMCSFFSFSLQLLRYYGQELCGLLFMYDGWWGGWVGVV